MSCPDPETLSAFADHELDGSAREIIERHLASCTTCREFVDEMSRLDTRARSSLAAIPATERRRSIVVLETKRNFRRLALAAAVVIVAAALASLWFYASRPERDTFPAGEAPEGGEIFQGSSDAAFERWAEPYRQLRIPLAPMEDVAKLRPPELPPTVPKTTKRNDKI